MTFENTGDNDYPDGYGDMPYYEADSDNTDPVHNETDDVRLVSGMEPLTDRVEPAYIYIPGPEDIPAFDVLQFEADAQARAAEFDAQVARLTVLGASNEFTPWVNARGAQYRLSDGTSVELKYETHDEQRIVTKIRVTHPPVEVISYDGVLRRTTLTRSLEHESSSENIMLNNPADLDDVVVDPHDIHLFDEVGRAEVEQIQEHRVEAGLDSGYLPGELIAARETALVECKLAKGPNFRVERYSPSMPTIARLSHEAARRRAGERADNPDYDIAEHQALMALLDTIDPVIIEPSPLDEEFDITWQDPPAPRHSWTPREQ
jgi:hypothetical protein